MGPCRPSSLPLTVRHKCRVGLLGLLLLQAMTSNAKCLGCQFQPLAVRSPWAPGCYARQTRPQHLGLHPLPPLSLNMAVL